MNRQEVFNRVAKHLLTQRKQSKTHEGAASCAYRGEKGLTCAIGCLITDEAYSPQIETCSVYWDGVQDALKESGIEIEEEADGKLLGQLQNIHDLHTPVEWRRELARVAKTFDLALPEGV